MEKGNLFNKAVAFAARAHDGQLRKGTNLPYIVHPIEAAAICASFTDDVEVLAAAVLHDTVEDTDATPAEVRELFGERTASLVASETENKRPDLPKSQSWRIRKEESLRELAAADDPAVLCLWLGDKLSNLRATARDCKLLGTPYWDRFNQKDPRAIKWYYVGVGEALRELKGCPAYEEYMALLAHAFEGCGDLSDAELAARLA
jgi:myo-inositol-1(or 4)-monophosphatase